MAGEPAPVCILLPHVHLLQPSILTYRIRWRPYIYTTPADNTSSLNLPPGSKGREAFAYLTYIIEKYDSLAPLTAFVHAAPTQWHNDADPETKSTAQLLSALQLDIVRERGFVNLRCTASPGCPVAVRPFDPVFKAKGNPVYSEFADIYMGLFNVSLAEVPVEIGGVCCGQFVVSAERIRQRGKDEYVRMREWAMGSDLDDLGVGSVFEMVWHVIFGEGAVLYVFTLLVRWMLTRGRCPDTTTCYCELYRQCDT